MLMYRYTYTDMCCKCHDTLDWFPAAFAHGFHWKHFLCNRTTNQYFPPTYTRPQTIIYGVLLPSNKPSSHFRKHLSSKYPQTAFEYFSNRSTTTERKRTLIKPNTWNAHYPQYLRIYGPSDSNIFYNPTEVQNSCRKQLKSNQLHIKETAYETNSTQIICIYE